MAIAEHFSTPLFLNTLFVRPFYLHYFPEHEGAFFHFLESIHELMSTYILVSGTCVCLCSYHSCFSSFCQPFQISLGVSVWLPRTIQLSSTFTNQLSGLFSSDSKRYFNNHLIGSFYKNTEHMYNDTWT